MKLKQFWYKLNLKSIKMLKVKDEQELTYSSQGSKTNFFKMLSPKSSSNLVNFS